MKNLTAPILALTLLLGSVAVQPKVEAQSAAPTAPKISLSAAQKTKIDQIRQDSRSQIQRLFSRKQTETYATLRKRGIPAAQAVEMIDLSRSRRDQLRRILTKSREQIVKVLGQS
ncbi:hypothetical protein IQ266_22485 [filamentous cyanobacterium LEGE 11480]|uniref:DUF4168 domain-containing protein n=1 Tax=Romeriopsis navalis LEGE 11480 TaxID=2777977 RepID=A0A928Z6S4_9CYAN|nr:Spy/CpxP family protein refolding chaperone [Romeriopsis navalis]MBE9032510.1 hypothetical protein [Romeriopsis navalis LEGE 11480]